MLDENPCFELILPLFQAWFAPYRQDVLNQ
jgi:hypothetical protein